MMEKTGRGGDRGGRRPETPIEEKKVISGKVRVRIDPAKQMVIPVSIESRALAQRLMLHFPEVPTVEALFEFALIRLAGTTDD